MHPFFTLRPLRIWGTCLAIGGLGGAIDARPVFSQSPDQASIASAASGSTDEISIDDVQFRVPKGYVFEKIAGDPLVQWPIAATWDEQGDLVIAESAGVRQTVEEQLKTRPHRIVRIRDTDRDGIYDARQVVATDLSFPEGVMCVGRDIYVTAPPQIWRLRDADGDGVCESREVWHDGKTLTGCANDLHGPFMGIDGWVYWSKSAFAEQTRTDLDGASHASRASHLYRRPLHETAIDRVMTGGMDNLVDVGFLPNGDIFFCSTFLHHPGRGLRDGIGYAAYGSVFGKEHAVLDGHWRTGPLMKPTTELGPAAPAGLHAADDALRWLTSLFEGPQSQQDRVLVSAQFNLQKVAAHRLLPEGAGFRTQDIDLVVGDKIDFHPVDVFEDRDGSLIVVDTGGWYDLCCPSSGKEERVAKGGIYRLTLAKMKSSYAKTSQAIEDRSKAPDPYAALGDVQAWVRTEAERRILNIRNENRETKFMKLNSLISDRARPLQNRLSAFWCAAKLLAQVEMPSRDEPVPAFVQSALRASEPDLRCAALHMVSLYRWKQAFPEITPLVTTESSVLLQRAAAETLGRLGRSEGIASLMDVYSNERPVRAKNSKASTDDRLLEHSLLYALMEIGDAEAMRLYLRSEHPRGTLAAIHVLHQLGRLNAEDRPCILKELGSPHKPLRQAAAAALMEDSEALPEVIQVLQKSIDRNVPDAFEAIEPILVRWKSSPQVIEWVGTLWMQNKPLREIDGLLLSLIRAYRNQALPESWTEGIDAWLTAADENTRSACLEQISEVQLPASASKLIDRLVAIGSDPECDERTQMMAVASLPVGYSQLPQVIQERLISSSMIADHPAHEYALRAIERLKLSSASVERLLEHAGDMSPLDLPFAMHGIARAEDAKIDAQVLQQMPSIPGARSLPVDATVAYFSNRDGAYRNTMRAALLKLQEPPSDIADSVDRLTQSLQAGDSHRGQDVFRSTRAACSACHRIGYVGGNIGPELTRIGQSRTRSDLVEAIAFPSQRLAQGFVSTRILTADGTILNGLVLSENSEQLEIAVSADKKVLVPKSDIERRETSSVSVMPNGLEKILSPQELSDLIAFLETCK